MYILRIYQYFVNHVNKKINTVFAIQTFSLENLYILLVGSVVIGVNAPLHTALNIARTYMRYKTDARYRTRTYSSRHFHLQYYPAITYTWNFTQPYPTEHYPTTIMFIENFIQTLSQPHIPSSLSSTILSKLLEKEMNSYKKK